MDAGRLGNLFIQVILHVLRAATVNSEGRCLTGGALKFALDWNYYDLVIDYDINVRRQGI